MPDGLVILHKPLVSRRTSGVRYAACPAQGPKPRSDLLLQTNAVEDPPRNMDRHLCIGL